MRDLTIFEIHENICDLYNLHADYKIEFGRQANRKIGRVLYAKAGFVKILFRGDIKTEIIQTTHLLLSPQDDTYGLLKTAYATTNG